MSNDKVSNKVFDMMTVAADKTDVDLEKPAKLEKSRKSIHTALMAAGMSPAYGNIADLTDATLYVLEGELGEAAWSAAAAIPIIGQMVSAKRAMKVAKESGEKMVTLYRGVHKWHRKEMVKNRRFVGPEVVSGTHIGQAHPTAKSRSLFVTDDPWYASERTASHFPIHQEKLLKSMKKEKYYFGDYGIRIWPDNNKFWNKEDFAKAIKKQEGIVESIKDTRRREGGGGKGGDFILEFEIPESWVKKFGKKVEGAYEGTTLFEEGLPVEFIKNIHK